MKIYTHVLTGACFVQVAQDGITCTQMPWTRSQDIMGFLSYNDNVKVKATCVAGTLFCCAFGKKENVNDCPLLK